MWVAGSLYTSKMLNGHKPYYEIIQKKKTNSKLYGMSMSSNSNLRKKKMEKYFNKTLSAL